MYNEENTKTIGFCKKMFKKIAVIFWFFLIYSMAVGADTVSKPMKKIVIRSFYKKSQAERELARCNEVLSREKRYAELREKGEFRLHARPSGRFYIVVIEPLRPEEARRLLPGVRRYYADAFVNRYSPPRTTIENKPATAAPHKKEKTLPATSARKVASAAAAQSDSERNETNGSVKENLSVPKSEKEVVPHKRAERMSAEKLERSESGKDPVSFSDEISKKDKSEVESPATQEKKERERSPQKIEEKRPADMFDSPVAHRAAASVEKVAATKEKDAPLSAWIWPAVAALLAITILGLLGWLDRLRGALRDANARVNDYQAACEEHRLLLENIDRIFRQPLETIRRSNQFILENGLDPSLYNNVSFIENSLVQLRGTLNDIRDFAALLNKRTALLERLEFNLNDTLEDVIRQIKRCCATSFVTIVFDIDPSMPVRFVGDRKRVQRILYNMLVAMAKSRQKGDVVLKVAPAQSEWEKEGDIVVAFQFTLHVTRVSGREKESQAKLHYLMAEKLVRMMHGQMEKIQTDAKEITWRLVLPLKALDEENRRKYRLPSKRFMNKKVYIFGASPHAVNSLEKMLEYFHYETHKIEKLSDIPGRRRKDRFDILFIDEKRFEEVSRDIKKLRQYAENIVLIEELGDEKKDGATACRGFDGCLTRPFSQQQLFALIVTIFRGRSKNSHGQ